MELLKDKYLGHLMVASTAIVKANLMGLEKDSAKVLLRAKQLRSVRLMAFEMG